MKIDKKFLEQLTGSLSKEKIEGESKEFGNIFNIINKVAPHDNKIDIEEITKFAISIWQEDNGDGKISDDEIESYMQKNQADFKNTNIKAKDIKKFLEFFVKNSEKTPDNTRIDNGDGTYSVVTQREDFEERQIVTNQKEIDEWNTKQNSIHNNLPTTQNIFNNTKPTNRNNNNEKENSTSSLFNEINETQTKNKNRDEVGFSTKQKEAQPKSSNKRPEPIYGTTVVSRGMISRKINYNSENQITTIEETRGNVTTVTDAEGNLLRTITKNEGAKDTIKEYKILDDGTKEESIFYGENGAKDSETPAYKNIYRGDIMIAREVPDENGQITQRQNITNGRIQSITKLNNGIEGETIQLFTNTDNYADPDKVFDSIIDPTKQNYTGDCWLLDGLSKLSKKSWGRQSIIDAISRDTATGNITIKFKHAYGETKEFTITPQELAQARRQTRKYYSFALESGDVVYIDGKRELRMPRSDSFNFDADSVKDNITFVVKNGKKYAWTKDDLESMDGGTIEGPKYSSNDLTVLACELAVEKSRQEAGLPLDGGYNQEVIAMFTDIDNMQIYINQALCKQHSQTNTETKTEQETDTHLYNEVDKLSQHINIKFENVNSQQMLEQLKKIMQNPDKYSCHISLKMDGGGFHAGQILRFEQKDGKDYVVYTHSWNEKAEVREELTHFVNNTLANIQIAEDKEYTPNIPTNSDSQIGTFQMGNKSNRTNFASAMAILGQDPNFKPNIQKEGENFVVTIKGEKMVITPNELETARTSGRYSSKDDDIPILELAVERYINKTRHNNTIYDLSHTNLEDVKIQDILNLFSESELKRTQSGSLKDASQKDGLKFAVSQKYDASIDGMRNTYYPIKEIKQTPDGKYLISVIQPEDTSVVVTYTEEEYKRIFNVIEIYN